MKFLKSKYNSFLQHLLKYLVFLTLLFFAAEVVAQQSDSLLFVQVPVQNLSDNQKVIKKYSPLDRYIEGTRIVSLIPGSEAAVHLTSEFYAAADPDISFDGKKILFAGRKKETDHWQIWEMNVDGSDKRQITDQEGDCYMPVYAGSRFYLDDVKPTPQIIYVGTAHRWWSVSDNGPSLSLYGTDFEGETTYRLSYNLFNDFSPDVLPDGRIIYSSWQVSGNETGISGRYAFMGINNDGTDVMIYYGNLEDPVYKDMINISHSDERVYFIESDQSIWLGGGTISQISQNRPLKSYKKLTKTTDGIYHSPCSTPGNGLLSSFRRDSTKDVFSIYRIDPLSGKRIRQLYREDGWHSIDIQLLVRHSKVKGRSNWLIPGTETGVLYCLDSYMTDIPELSDMKSGTIKYVRLLEGLAMTEKDVVPYKKNEALVSKEKWMYPRKILGTVPVEKDGSFHVKIPAEIPVNFQLLDKNLMVIGKQETWIWVSGNENRGCIGCHETRELSPPNILVDAVTKPAHDLTHSEQHKTVDFKHQIAPIVRNKCATVDCHGSGKVNPEFVMTSKDKIKSLSRDVYEKFLTTNSGNTSRSYVIPANARESSLIWHILNMESAFENKSLEFHKSSKKLVQQLTVEEKTNFIEWIDTGAFWDLTILTTLESHPVGHNKQLDH